MTANPLERARTFGILDSRSVVRRDSVDQLNPVDSYRFSLSRSSNVTVQLSGLRANADLLLLNSTGQVIGRSTRGSNRSEQVMRQLPAGVYFVQVHNRTTEATKYRLGTTAAPGNRENPIDLGLLSGNPVTRTRETAGNTPVTKKHYKFQLAQTSNTSITLSQITGGGNLRLFYDSDRNGNFDLTDMMIRSGESNQFVNQPFSLVLPAPGTYFFEVDRSSAFNTMAYDLTVSTTAIPGNLPADPGSEPMAAHNFGALNRGGRFEASDYVGQIDLTDTYRFSLSTSTYVTIDKQDMAGSINVETQLFRDGNNNSLLEPNESVLSLTSSRVEQKLRSGTYYLVLKQKEPNNTAYRVTLSAN